MHVCMHVCMYLYMSMCEVTCKWVLVYAIILIFIQNLTSACIPLAAYFTPPMYRNRA